MQLGIPKRNATMSIEVNECRGNIQPGKRKLVYARPVARMSEIDLDTSKGSTGSCFLSYKFLRTGTNEKKAIGNVYFIPPHRYGQ